MNLFRFCFVTEIAACLLMAVQPAFAVAPELGKTSSPIEIIPAQEGETLTLDVSARDAAIKQEQSLAKITSPDSSLILAKKNNTERTAIAEIKANIKTESSDENQALIQKKGSAEKSIQIAQFPGQIPNGTNLPAPASPVVPNQTTSPNGVLVPNPEIIIKSNGTSNPDIISPNVPNFPALPRAIAPPVGDISISNINPSYNPIDLGPSGRTVVPRLVLRQAPVKEVLMVLARYAGVNIIFTDGDAAPPGATTPPPDGAATTGLTNISLDLQNEPVQQVFNSVLMVSGLKANRQGSTIFVGAKLPDAARNIVTRTLRLNQAKAEKVATFLASQGAEVNFLFQEEETTIEVAKQKIDSATGELTTEAPKITKKAPTLKAIKAEKVEGSEASFILKGLLVSTDDRLNLITLTGEPRQIEMATSMVTQMDARRRQVSINVKVVDINLSNSQTQSVDFNFGDGNGYGYHQLNSVQGFNNTVLNFGNGVAGALGGLIPDPTQFNATINYAIATGNAKVLTDPTIVVQEGQFASIALVQKVLSGSTTTVVPSTGGGNDSFLTTPTFEYVGLTLGMNVEGIDDNGFISIVVKPTISRPYDTVTFNSGGIGAANTFTLTTKREVQSGLIRLRDGQTLILTGIITEQDQSDVTKVPILGDIPFLGVLFRSQVDSTQRSEVVVMLTPKIIHDDQNSQFGYNYTPSRATSDFLNQQNFPAQVQP